LSLININNFKGLAQNVDYTGLKLNYSHLMENLDVDRPLGVMKVRHGSAKKYSDVFTSILSAYEYYYEKATETKLLINDNGTLKVLTDGASLASLSLPSGSTLASSFRCQFFGWRDHVIITTGTGATNHVLGYYYLDRAAANNKGCFGDAEEFNSGSAGYALLRSQLIEESGNFSKVSDIVKVGDYFYMTFQNSKWVEKRDSSWKLVDRVVIDEDDTDNDDALLTTDGTYLYVGVGSSVHKVEPPNLGKVVASITLSAADSVTGICHDGQDLWVCTLGRIYELNPSTLGENAVDASRSGTQSIIAITCDDTVTTGNLYIVDNDGGSRHNVHRVAKDSLGSDAATFDNSGVDVGGAAGDFSPRKVEYDDGEGGVMVTSNGTYGGMVELAIVGLTYIADETLDGAYGLFFIDTMRTGDCYGVSGTYGFIQEYNGSGTQKPSLVQGMISTTSGSTDLVAGTYFYKFSIVDDYGQEFTLSDPIAYQATTAVDSITLRLTAYKGVTIDDHFFRMNKIRVYRGYSDDVDAELPGTDYKFLKDVNINDSHWTYYSAGTLYYYDYIDTTTEDLISTTTYLESSGIGDAVLPRYINYKYLEWVNSQLHCANFSHDGDSFPNRIIQSPDDAPDSIALYDYYDFDVGEGDTIKDIASVGDRTMVFKTLKFGVFFNGSYERTYDPGLVSEKAWCVHDDLIYFMSNQGLYVFDGIRLVNLRDPVLTYFDAGTHTNSVVFHAEKLNRIVFTGWDNNTYVYNYKYKLWMHYPTNPTSVFGFRGYFKNQDDEYIAYNGTTFYEVFNDTYVNDEEDVGGGNGSGISIVYESPLIKPTNFEGGIIIPISHRHRLLKGSENVLMVTYRYDTSGKTLVDSQLLSAPGGAFEAAKSYFYDSEVGESFQIYISSTITGGDFEHHGITIEYEVGEHWFV